MGGGMGGGMGVFPGAGFPCGGFDYDEEDDDYDDEDVSYKKSGFLRDDDEMF